MTYSLRLTAVQRLVSALLSIFLWAAVVTLLTASEPWFGVTLVPTDAGQVVIADRDADGPAAAADPGSALLSLSTPGGTTAPIELSPVDIVEEPDVLESYAAFNDFLARQSAIYDILSSGSAVLAVQNADGAVASLPVDVHSHRPLASLPDTFWFQLGCAVVILVIASWMTSLRPGDRQVRRFALAGVGAALSTSAAAIYSSRELALDGGYFHALAVVNHAGAIMFGIYMIGLFCIYPTPLRVGRLFEISAVLLGAFVVLNPLQLAGSITIGVYLSILLAMVAILVLIAMQFVATRGDIRSRRALLWLGMSVVVGAGAFSVLIAVPVMLGEPSVLTQAHSFGFFPVIYLGVALGLARYRLFDLDRWAFDVLTYVFAVLLFIGIDLLLVLTLAINFSVSLGLTALIVGLFYLPFRNWLADRLVGQGDPDLYGLFRTATEIALQPSTAARAARWQSALADTFLPLTIELGDNRAAEPAVADEGLTLEVPAYPWSPALDLRHNAKGRRLFGEPHAAMVRRFAELVSEAEASREAYDRGAREERRRIGRDLHDNVGAMLMSSLRAAEPGRSRELVRNALGDIREIVNGLSERNVPLADVVAAMRAETGERLSGLAFDWPLGDADASTVELPYAAYRNLTSAHREMISNVLRHTGASRVVISTDVADDALRHRVVNDIGLPAARDTATPGGNGIVNLRARAAELGGSFEIALADDEAIAEFVLPLRQETAR